MFRIYCFLVFLLCYVKANAQLKSKIEHYSTENGLSHDLVLSMIEDRKGFMWFGTVDGINRFDGRRFRTYKSNAGDNSILKNNRIDEIAEDGAGYLWLRAYDNQIYRFDKKTERFLALATFLKEADTKKIVFDKIIPSEKQGVWLRSKDAGLFFVPQSSSSSLRYFRYASGLKKDFSLAANTISFIHEGKGCVWIGTKSGLNCLVRDNAGIYRNKDLKPAFVRKYNFLSIAEDRDRVWLGTAEGYLIVYEKASGKFLKKQVSSGELNGICVSQKSNVVYLATSESEIITVNQSDLTASSSYMAGAAPFYSLYEDKAGRVWIEPEKHGIIRFKPVENTFKYFYQQNDANYFVSSEAYKVYEDRNGILWTSMKGGGFGYYDPSKDVISYFNNEPNFSNHRFSNIVGALHYNRDGVLWLSTDAGGIDKIIFHGNNFNHHLLVQHTFFKSDNEIRGIYSDHQNRLWLGAKSGKLYVSKNGKKITDLFINESSGGLGHVYTILQDKSGAIWLGTKANGLFKAVPVNKEGSKYKLTHYRTDTKDRNSLSSDAVYSIFEDVKGRIWIGTFEGGLNLAIEKDHQTSFINIRNSFGQYPKKSFNKIRHITQDAQGKIWIGTTDGLLILDADRGNTNTYVFTGYTKIPGDQRSLGNNDVHFIYKDSKNTMWICTSGGGLNKAVGLNPIKSLTFNGFTMKDGLPSEGILSCVEDNNQNLWLATQNGLSQFNIRKEQFRNYDSYDGLPITRYSEASCLKMPDGDLIFGSINGYVSFNPDHILNHKLSPNLVFTNLQINNKDVVAGNESSPLHYNIDETAHITLKHDQNVIAIDYAVLDFRSNNKESYSYRLKGYDKGWNDNRNQQRAIYSNIPPGKYVFEVKSSSSDFYSNVPAKQLAITILPPPWLSWWAYILYFILIVILIEGARRVALTMLRLKQRIIVEREMADLKLNFFTKVSHELRTPLTLILNPINDIFKKEALSEQGLKSIHIVRKNADRMVRFINQLLDLRKLQSGKTILKKSKVEVVSFVRIISEYFTEVARERGIRLDISSETPEFFAYIDADKIETVVYNLLSNALKFSPKGKSVRILVSKIAEWDWFSIEVADEGSGVPEDKLNTIFELFYEEDHGNDPYLRGSGIGLALSKELVELHNGRIAAANMPSGGFRVSITLPTLLEEMNKDADQSVHAAKNKTLLVEELIEPVQDVTARAKQDHGNSPVVLLVEDNDDLRRLLANQLSEFYSVVEAGNGEEAVEIALKCIPDLVLSDVMMPKMDGIQMLNRLKNEMTTSHIPIILLSARSSIENQIEGLKYGADYYITKPFQTEFLIASMDNLLYQRSRLFESLINKSKILESAPVETGMTEKDEQFLKEVIKIVEHGLINPQFNIDTVAVSIGMSRSAFYKKLKSLTNLAPVEFVREMRLAKGKELLDKGGNNISDIAFMIGFSNAKYFSTCFKDHYDMTPSEYLKTKV